MKLVILGGQSYSNLSWINDISSNLEGNFNITIFEYEHWKSKGNEANVAFESKKLLEMLNSIEGDYMIFAKSIGTVITLNIFEKLTSKPIKMIFVGVPYLLAKEQGYDFMKLKVFTDIPVVIYQKEYDPYCHYETLKEIGGNGVNVFKYECVDEPNNNHNYANMNTIKNILTN